jgi:hypothetical protein
MQAVGPASFFNMKISKNNKKHLTINNAAAILRPNTPGGAHRAAPRGGIDTMQTFWTEKKSILLSRALTAGFTVLLAAADAGGWWIVKFICDNVVQNHGAAGFWSLLVCLYLCSIPAYLLLFGLYRLLRNMEADRVFIAENVLLLRRVSWCCVFAAAICLCASPAWPSLLLVAVAAAFMALIVRVVKNVFVRAIGMKDELDFTV